MFRSLILASALCASGAAFAADLPMSAPAPEPYLAPAPVFTWTGFYLGVNGGYAGDKFDYPISETSSSGANLLSGSASLTSGGFIGGGQIGYNYQMGSIILGLEADIDAADIDGKLSANAGGSGGSLGVSAGSSIDYLGTVRGRLGWAFLPRAMIYATGGFAYGGIKNSYAISGTGFDGASGSTTNTGTGWTVGGGIEYAVTDHWTFKAEYLYADLGKHTLLSDAIDDSGDVLTIKNDAKVNIVRAGLNYKF